MGVLRGFGIVIVSILLFLSLIATGIFATLNYSLTYENVQPKINTVATQVIEEQIGSQEIVNQLLPFLETYCQNATEIVQSFGNYTFVFPCKIVSQGESQIINYTVNYLIEDFYYKNYNCSFTKCFEQSDMPLFLVSKYAKDYWNSLYKKFLLFDLILIALTILLVEKKSNAPILTGALLIPSALIISQLKNIGTRIAKLILSPISSALSSENTNEIINQIVGIFFNESAKVFLWMFIAGIILILIGLILKLTSLGIKIKNWLDKTKGKKKIAKIESNQKEISKKVNTKN